MLTRLFVKRGVFLNPKEIRDLPKGGISSNNIVWDFGRRYEDSTVIDLGGKRTAPAFSTLIDPDRKTAEKALLGISTLKLY